MLDLSIDILTAVWVWLALGLASLYLAKLWFVKMPEPVIIEKPIPSFPAPVPLETWEVRWQSRSGDFSTDTRPEVATFYSPEEAEAFRLALVAAFKMIRHTGKGTEVGKVKKTNNEC